MKHISLSPDELRNISRLLLSASEESAALGYELLKQHSSYVPELLHELILILMLGTATKLQAKVKRFLSSRYKKSGEYQQWTEEWALFKKLPNVYSYSKLVPLLLEQHEKVRQDFYPFVAQNSYYLDHYYEIGRILQHSFKEEKDYSLRYYEDVLKAEPNRKHAWFNLAYLYSIEYKDINKAKDCYLKCLSIDPNNAGAYNNLGVISANHLNDFENALYYYDKALSLNPSYLLYQMNVASMSLRTKQFERFEYLINTIFAANRKNQRALNMWCIYLWEEKKDYILAEEEFKFAIGCYPDDEDLLGNFGEMYEFALGRYEEAYNLYIKSLEIEKSTYRLTTLISLLVLHLDKKEEAKYFYEELLVAMQEEGIKRHRDLNDKQWEDFLKVERILLKNA